MSNPENETNGAVDRVIAIGGSAGAIDALLELLPHLIPGIAASILVVIHTRAHEPFHLPGVLRRDSLMRLRVALDGEPLEPSSVYLAPPDSQMTIDTGRLHVGFGPTENGHRPSIDTTFRSVAAAFGPNAIGVLLSGTSVDGVAGLHAIHEHGGTTVVQDPDDAIFPGLPRAANRVTHVDHVTSISAMPALFDKVLAPAPAGGVVPSRQSTEQAAYDVDPDTGLPTGHPSPLACPDCGGVLWQVVEGNDLVRYRCRVGHAWTADSLLDAQDAQSEAALWTALRALEEQAELAKRMAQHASGRDQPWASNRYTNRFDRLRNHATRLRELLEATYPAPPNELELPD